MIKVLRLKDSDYRTILVTYFRYIFNYLCHVIDLYAMLYERFFIKSEPLLRLFLVF